MRAEQHLANYDLYTYSGSYYDGIDFDAAGGMNGALRESLTSLIIPKGFYTYGKTGETHLATQLQYADEDPTNSNNMVYLYTRDSVTKNAAQSWNREHVWCQSLSNGNWGTSEGGTDILHLRPTYGSVNSSRGNTPYGDTNKATAKKYNNMLYGYTGGGYFEPIDAVKGDVARIVMYVWTTYTNYKDYSALDILDVFQSYNTLLSWHTMDKPDVLEGNRNDYCQTSRQKNRNPFVDHPELAWKIFGNNVSDSVKNACMAAYPAESGGSGEPTGIRLNKTTASVEAGKTLQLTATIEPAGATGTVSWSTNNSSVATVSSGLVTTKAEGMATITASVGGFSASCAVNVTAAGSINYGTEDNPISVADAIEIIDKTGASETAQPLYVRGIVSSNTALDANYNDYEIWLKNDDDNVAEAFNLYHVKADSSITSVYQDANSLKDFEVVAYGYGKKYNNTTYELTTSSRTPKNPSLLSVSPPEATGIAFDQYSVELEAGETTTITVTLTPSNSESTINWTSSNESVATVSNGVITAVAAGSAVITASVSDDVEEECYVTVTGGQSELVKVASYDFSTGNTATSEYDSSGLLARFTSSAASGTGLSDIVDDVTSLTKVYAGFTGYTEFGIKFGTKGNSGSFTLSLNKEVTRVVVNTSGWGASDSLTIGDADPQVPGVAYTGTNPIKT